MGPAKGPSPHIAIPTATEPSVWLQQDGVTQREIARRTGQSQSEVSEILRGRRVRDVGVEEHRNGGRR